MRAGADLRVLRAAVFAAVCATLAALGHLTARGPAIPLWAIAAGWAAVFAVAAPLAGRERRSVPAIAAALAAAQLALHCLYCLGQHTARPATDTAHPGHAVDVVTQAARLLCNDHVAHLTPAKATEIVTAAGLTPGPAPGMEALGAPGTVAPADHLGAALADSFASLGSVPMLLGHLLAAVAAACLLRRGEAALWRLVHLSTRWSAEAIRRVQALLSLLSAAGHVLLTALRRLAHALASAPPERGATRHTPRGRPRHAPTLSCVAAVPPHAVIRRGPPAQRLTLAA